MKAPVTDRCGIVIEPDLHDGWLRIILSPNGEDLTLLCRSIDVKDFSILVPELVKLRVENFLEGNIIYEVKIREGGECPAVAVQKVFNYADDEVGKYLPGRMKEIVHGKWTLIELTASYGCELLALSKARGHQVTVS